MSDLTTLIAVLLHLKNSCFLKHLFFFYQTNFYSWCASDVGMHYFLAAQNETMKEDPSSPFTSIYVNMEWLHIQIKFSCNSVKWEHTEVRSVHSCMLCHKGSNFLSWDKITLNRQTPTNRKLPNKTKTQPTSTSCNKQHYFKSYFQEIQWKKSFLLEPKKTCIKYFLLDAVFSPHD